MAKFKADIVIPASLQMSRHLDSMSKIKRVIAKALGIPTSYVKLK